MKTADSRQQQRLTADSIAGLYRLDEAIFAKPQKNTGLTCYYESSRKEALSVTRTRHFYQVHLYTASGEICGWDDYVCAEGRVWLMSCVRLSETGGQLVFTRSELDILRVWAMNQVIVDIHEPEIVASLVENLREKAGQLSEKETVRLRGLLKNYARYHQS